MGVGVMAGVRVVVGVRVRRKVELRVVFAQNC